MKTISRFISRLRERSGGNFLLDLSFAPSFHPPSQLAVGVDQPGQLVFSVQDGPETLVYRASVSNDLLGRLRKTCLRSLGSYDRWERPIGLDGISVSGRFASTDFNVSNFNAWSPSPGSPAHALVAAALDCLPLHSVSGDIEPHLEWLRSYFELDGQVRIIPGPPLRLRLSCWASDRREDLARALASLPATGDLIVDLSNLARLGSPDLFMLGPLVRRGPSVRWQVSLRSLPVVEALGVPPDRIVDYALLKEQEAEEARRVEQERALQQERQRKHNEDVARRLDEARQKAIALGLATAENVDRVIYDLPATEFRRHFAEFQLSRVFFKRR